MSPSVSTSNAHPTLTSPVTVPLPIVDLLGEGTVEATLLSSGPMSTAQIIFETLDMKPELLKLATERPRILTIGSASRDVKFLLKRYPLGSVTAIDISWEQLKGISRYFRSDGDAGLRLTLIRADASALDRAVFPNESFDLVHAEGVDITAFHRYSAAQQILNSMCSEEFRVLRNGGILYHPNTKEFRWEALGEGTLIPVEPELLDSPWRKSTR